MAACQYEEKWRNSGKKNGRGGSSLSKRDANVARSCSVCNEAGRWGVLSPLHVASDVIPLTSWRDHLKHAPATPKPSQDVLVLEQDVLSVAEKWDVFIDVVSIL